MKDKLKKLTVLGKTYIAQPVSNKNSPHHAKCAECGKLSRLYTARVHKVKVIGTWCTKHGWRKLKER